MSLSFGIPSRSIKPRCDECNAAGTTHPYPKPDATERQLNGSVMGGYNWLCGDCAYIAEHGGEVVRVPHPARLVGPPQRERLFDA